MESHVGDDAGWGCFENRMKPGNILLAKCGFSEC
jgi:hypothetical protein